MRRERSAAAPPLAEAGWAYFLDVDGTLVEIAEAPDAVQVDDDVLRLVARLHRTCDGALALVSGRSLADLEGRLGSIGVPLVGQHGLERRDASGRLQRTVTAAAVRGEIRRQLEPVIARHPGLLLEDKGLSLALHYRQAPRLAAYVHRLMRTLVSAAGSDLGLQIGKRVVEVKPAGVDKGSAIEEFMAEPPFKGRRPVFVGDDVTDEHGFATINRLGGVSIKVGRGRTQATWRLPNVTAVRGWLAGALGAYARAQV
jgi:trehalose 6-phosphate phosphatase